MALTRSVELVAFGLCNVQHLLISLLQVLLDADDVDAKGSGKGGSKSSKANSAVKSKGKKEITFIPAWLVKSVLSLLKGSDVP